MQVSVSHSSVAHKLCPPQHVCVSHIFLIKVSPSLFHLLGTNGEPVPLKLNQVVFLLFEIAECVSHVEGTAAFLQCSVVL